MLEHNRIDVSKGIDVNKTNVLCEWIICHYWHFFEINFRFDPKVCNCCHDLMKQSMSFNNAAIVYVKGNDYRTYFWCMSKDKAIFRNVDLTEKFYIEC